MLAIRKILKVGNSRALILDRIIAEALGLDSSTNEIPVSIENGRVVLSPPESQDVLTALRKELAHYPDAVARKMAVDAVAAVRPATIKRWKAASRK